MAEGKFREDLLYRINTIHLHLPALRERKGDVAALARIFLRRYAIMYNKSDMAFSRQAEEKSTHCRGMAMSVSCNMLSKRR